MYTEQIAYAYKLSSTPSKPSSTTRTRFNKSWLPAYPNRFIPQANRALRPFNLFLNTPPLTSPLQLFVSPKEPLGNLRPPLVHPRGELLFSSKVSTPFIDGYERYRTEWERRRPPAPTLFGAWRNSGPVTPARVVVKKPVSSRASTPDLLLDEALSESSSVSSPQPPSRVMSVQPTDDQEGEWCTVRRWRLTLSLGPSACHTLLTACILCVMQIISPLPPYLSMKLCGPRSHHFLTFSHLWCFLLSFSFCFRLLFYHISRDPLLLFFSSSSFKKSHY